MKKKLLESIPCDGLKYATHVDVEVNYSKDRLPRGYYLHVSPIKHEGDTISFLMSSYTVTLFLMETNRYSDKQFEQAVELGKTAAPELIELVIEKNKAA